MELQKVSQAAKIFGISTRTLRYYEQVGLIQSIRDEDNSYRYYDAAALKRVQQIVILRKLQIPVKQIAIILNRPDATTATEIFNENITALENEIAALETIKSALQLFAAKIEEIANLRLNLDILTDETVMELAGSLSLTQKNVREVQTMENLNRANATLDKLTDKDVRIVYLPPATVASLHFVGNDEEGRIPEDQGEDAMAALVKQLAEIKPDCRHYGFNHSADGQRGYERWFTIPDDMELPAPFVKKQFPGGVYGAYALRTWDNEWELLVGWANSHDKYEFAQGSYDTMLGILEEHLNVMGHYMLPGVKHDTQVDLLVPLKEKQGWPNKLGYLAGSEEKCGFKASLIEKEAFTAVGYRQPPKAASSEEFYKKLTEDGRLECMKSALKPNTPILVYHHSDGGYKINVCADINEAVDGKYFESKKMNVKKIAKKKWIEFELKLDDIKNDSWDKFQPHDLVGKLGYKFDGSAGFFFVYYGELVATEGNKNDLLYCWMPVIPL